MKETEVNYVVVAKPRTILKNTIFDYFLVEVQEVLNEHVDIVVDDFPNDLPLVRSISHHIDMTLGASILNKAPYRMTPKENEEIKNKV